VVYDLFIHRHNFAVWAAARAAQRNFTNVQNLKDALESSGIQHFLLDPASLDTQPTRFEELHRAWCRAICQALTARNVKKKVAYGRAAKLVAIYLKSMVICGGAAYSALGRAIHPPIDRRLLQALAAEPAFAQTRAEWRQINWTQLEEDRYYRLIQQLRSALPQEIPFWMLEEYWTVADDEE
jgi:hypothetical protein